MALPLTGPLKMSQVNLEAKLGSTARQSLGSTIVRTIALKPTGRISFSDLRGKTALISKTYTFSNTISWKAPAHVSSVILVGKGGRGNNARTYISGYTLNTTTSIKGFDPPTSVVLRTLSSFTSSQPSTASAVVPASYCEPGEYNPPSSTNRGDYSQVCVSYGKITEYETIDAEYGGDSSAFGYTFLGRFGSTPATSSPVTVAVTPGQTYRLEVADGSGAFIQLTYDDIP